MSKLWSSKPHPMPEIKQGMVIKLRQQHAVYLVSWDAYHGSKNDALLVVLDVGCAGNSYPYVNVYECDIECIWASPADYFKDTCSC